MKTRLPFIVAILSVISSSCVKEDIGPRLRREAEEKLLGTWILERRVTEVYQPIVAYPVPGTGATTQYNGTANDYFDFQSAQVVEIDTAGTGATQHAFEVINPSQVFIDDNSWRIETHTARNLLLVRDINDGPQDRRYITKLYFKR